MREIIALFSVLMIAFLFCIGLNLPEDKLKSTKVITIVNNEILLNKSYKSISCDYSPCYEYYANFLNKSVLINQETYNRIKTGEKITLTVIDKNPTLVLWLLVIVIFFFVFVVIACACTQPKYEGSGEYYG